MLSSSVEWTSMQVSNDYSVKHLMFILVLHSSTSIILRELFAQLLYDHTSNETRVLRQYVELAGADGWNHVMIVSESSPHLSLNMWTNERNHVSLSLAKVLKAATWLRCCCQLAILSYHQTFIRSDIPNATYNDADGSEHDNVKASTRFFLEGEIVGSIMLIVRSLYYLLIQ